MLCRSRLLPERHTPGFMTPVLGPKHPRIAELRRLFGRRSSRSPEIILEGPRTVGEALDAGHMPTTVLVPESKVDHGEIRSVQSRLGDNVEYLVLRDHLFDKFAPSVTPQPMLAIVPRPQAELPIEASEDDVFLVLIDVSDPGNVGTLIRAADAVAARAVIVAGGADPWGTKAVRSSAGSVLRVPVISGIDASDALDALQAIGVRVVGTNVHSGEPHDGGVLARPCAIVVGSEPHGLDSETGVDEWCRIDMPGRTESLNVAMAGTLLLYEAVR